MAGWRQAVELAMSDEETGKLAVIARSGSEAARRVKRARAMHGSKSATLANAAVFPCRDLLDTGDRAGNDLLEPAPTTLQQAAAANLKKLGGTMTGRKVQLIAPRMGRPRLGDPVEL